jgi:hypothetical protein
MRIEVERCGRRRFARPVSILWWGLNCVRSLVITDLHYIFLFTTYSKSSTTSLLSFQNSQQKCCPFRRSEEDSPNREPQPNKFALFCLLQISRSFLEISEITEVREQFGGPKLVLLLLPFSGRPLNFFLLITRRRRRENKKLLVFDLATAHYGCCLFTFTHCLCFCDNFDPCCDCCCRIRNTYICT